MKINETQARVLIYCKTPRRPKEMWAYWENDKNYAYICNVMSGLEMLGMMTKRNIRHRGKNATYYTTTIDGLFKAEEVLSKGDKNGHDISMLKMQKDTILPDESR